MLQSAAPLCNCKLWYMYYLNQNSVLREHIIKYFLPKIKSKKSTKTLVLAMPMRAPSAHTWVNARRARALCLINGLNTRALTPRPLEMKLARARARAYGQVGMTIELHCAILHASMAYFHRVKLKAITAMKAKLWRSCAWYWWWADRT